MKDVNFIILTCLNRSFIYRRVLSNSDLTQTQQVLTRSLVYALLTTLLAGNISEWLDIKIPLTVKRMTVLQIGLHLPQWLHSLQFVKSCKSTVDFILVHKTCNAYWVVRPLG